MARDLAQEMDAWDGAYPPAWRPRTGDKIVGRVLRYASGHTMYGEVRTCLIETDGGERFSLWLSSTVLLGCFQRERPRPGERLALRYDGVHPEKKYKRWTLIVDRDEPPSFAALGGERVVEEEPVVNPYARATMCPQQRQPAAVGAGPRGVDPDDPF